MHPLHHSIQSDLSHCATISAKEALHKNASVYAKNSFPLLIPPKLSLLKMLDSFEILE